MSPTSERKSLQDSPGANESNRAAIEAEIVGSKALGKDYKNYRQQVAHDSASYKGPIVGQTDKFVVQKITPRDTVRHHKHKLPGEVKDGSNLTISYGREVHIAPIAELKHSQKHVRSL